MGIHATELGFTQDARLGAIDADASTLGEVSSAVGEHAQSLRSIAGDLGLSGLVADAAGEAVNDLGRQLLDLADAVSAVQRGVTTARTAMSAAQAAHDALPEVALTSSERAVVTQYAAVPAAGYAASAQREYYLHQHELAREAAAAAALDQLSRSLASAASDLAPSNDVDKGEVNRPGSSGGATGRATVPTLPATTVPALPRVTAPTIPDPVRVADPVVTTPTLPVPGDPVIDPRPIPNVDGTVGGTVPGGTHSAGGSGWTQSGPGGSGPSWGAGLAVGGLALGAGGLTRGLATGGGLAGLGSSTGSGSIGGAAARGGTGVLGGTGPGGGAGATGTGTGTGGGTGSTAGGMTALGGGGGATAGRGGVLGSGSTSGRTAMPGGGAGGSGSSKKRRRDALGYLAPEVDELDDAALPTTLRGARAGDRDSAALPVAIDDES